MAQREDGGAGAPLVIDATAVAPGARLGAQMLALNVAHEAELSPLDGARLRHLVGQAFAATWFGDAQGGLAAFLIAFDEGAEYDSPNYLWFRARLARFVYVDRIVVAACARGAGLARLLYADLCARAVAAGHEQVVCEVNVSPPNPGSDAFHAALGFVEMGGAVIHGGSKTVRYLRLGLG